MSRLLQALHSGRVLLMDGGMGSELIRAGLRPGECGERWNLSRPQQVRDIQRAYIAAGARCLLTNSFQANPAALTRHTLDGHLERIITAATRIARSAGGAASFVLADVG